MTWARNSRLAKPKSKLPCPLEQAAGLFHLNRWGKWYQIETSTGSSIGSVPVIEHKPLRYFVVREAFIDLLPAGAAAADYQPEAAEKDRGVKAEKLKS
jgi:hypothetical protein